MLTPEQVDYISDRMGKLCISDQEEIARKIPEFFEFLGNPDVSKTDLRKAEKKFNTYISKLISSLRKKSNRILIETMEQTVKKSLQSDKKLVSKAAEAGAEMEVGDGK